MPTIAAIPDEERQLVRKEIQQTRDKNYARQLSAMLILNRGMAPDCSFIRRPMDKLVYMVLKDYKTSGSDMIPDGLSLIFFRLFRC